MPLLKWDLIGTTGCITGIAGFQPPLTIPSNNSATETREFEVISGGITRLLSEAVDTLNASGHVIKAEVAMTCVGCHIRIRTEAWWKCKRCGEFSHFRCLPPTQSGPSSHCSLCFSSGPGPVRRLGSVHTRRFRKLLQRRSRNPTMTPTNEVARLHHELEGSDNSDEPPQARVRTQ